MLFEKRKGFPATWPSAHHKPISYVLYPLVLAAPDLHSVSIRASSVYFESDLFCLIWVSTLLLNYYFELNLLNTVYTEMRWKEYLSISVNSDLGGR